MNNKYSLLMSSIRSIHIPCTLLSLFVILGFVFLPNILSQELNWTKEYPMPIARSEIAAAVLNGNLYIIGGFDKSGQSTSTVNVYTPVVDRWNTAAPLPRSIDHAVAASQGGKMYVVGGGYTLEEGLSDKLFIYNVNTNDWTEGASLPAARGALTANFINGTLYAVGGVDASGASNDNLAYDPKTNIWTEKAPMPTAREHLTSAVVDGRLYAIGGRQIDSGSPKVNLNNNEMYNPLNDSWTVVEQMPTKRSGIAAASSPVDNNIYVFGGENPFKDEGPIKTFDIVEKYNPKTNNWTIEQPMPTARHGLAAISYDNKIYVIAGGNKPGLFVSNVNEVLSLNSSNAVE